LSTFATAFFGKKQVRKKLFLEFLRQRSLVLSSFTPGQFYNFQDEKEIVFRLGIFNYS